MLNRALLYLRRKNKRTVLLFILLFFISFSLFIGLSVWSSIEGVTKEVQRQLGTSFIVTKPPIQQEGSEYYKRVPTHDGNMLKVYCGPMVNQDFVQQVMQLDGITAYNGELEEWVCADNIKLIPGIGEAIYQSTISRPEQLEYALELEAKGEIGGFSYTELIRANDMIYGNTDSSLYDKFRTGAFELTEGRHISSRDKRKVLISDKLAEQNHLQIGDTVQISIRATNIGDYKDPKRVLGNTELEVVGIFHVNGYQPTGEWVHEENMTYNWLLTDLDTVQTMSEICDQNFYVDFVNDFCYENLTFFVDEPERLDEIIDQVRRSGIAGTDIFQISKDDTMYKSTVEPLKSIRNVVTGLTLAIIAGCVIVLLIVFTMWVRSRRQETAVYLSLGIGKAKILGQFMLEAVIVAAVALAVALPVSVPVSNAVGNRMLAHTLAEAQPEEKSYTDEELYQAALNGKMSELFAYDSGSYVGPEHIDFSLGLKEILLLIALELLIIAAAVCKGGWFLVTLEPRKIMTMMS